MKINYLFKTLVIVLFLRLISCEETEDNIDNSKLIDNTDNLKPIEIINNIVDIDNDNISDFEFFEDEAFTLDIPSSFGLVEKSISPINEYEFLTDNDYEPIYFKAGDTIRSSDFENKKFFKSSSVTLLEKERNYEIYDVNWTIKNLYVVFKNETHIGWLSFNLNIENGEINIINHDISENNFSIIN